SQSQYGVDTTLNTWPQAGSRTNAYSSEYKYDLNGNITYMKRYGWLPAPAMESSYLMDSLNFDYAKASSAPGSPLVNNQLLHIRVAKVVRSAGAQSGTVAYEYSVRDGRGNAVATYVAEVPLGNTAGSASLKDHALYVQKRFGIWAADGHSPTANGMKRYEMA